MPLAAQTASSPSPYKRERPDRRRHYRAKLTLSGRFMFNGADQTLQTINVSCGGALMRANVCPAIGDTLVCYFDDLGRLNTTVTRATDDGFAVTFSASSHKRDKLADRLVWLLNHKRYNLADEREAPRKPLSNKAMITLSDGRRIQCRVSDISLTGAAFKTDGPTLRVGERITAGTLTGEVVRSDRDGFAVRFLHKKQEQAT